MSEFKEGNILRCTSNDSWAFRKGDIVEVAYAVEDEGLAVDFINKDDNGVIIDPEEEYLELYAESFEEYMAKKERRKREPGENLENQFSCPGCETIYDEDDIEVFERRHRKFSSEEQVIVCPVCGQVMHVSCYTVKRFFAFEKSFEERLENY